MWAFSFLIKFLFGGWWIGSRADRCNWDHGSRGHGCGCNGVGTTGRWSRGRTELIRRYRNAGRPIVTGISHDVPGIIEPPAADVVQVDSLRMLVVGHHAAERGERLFRRQVLRQRGARVIEVV